MTLTSTRTGHWRRHRHWQASTGRGPEAGLPIAGSQSVTIRKPCLGRLKTGTVPKASLPAIDPGPLPAGFPNLTIMEALIISPSRLHCHVLTLTPGRRYESHAERTEDGDGHKVDWTTASTGHTVAATPQPVKTVLPGMSACDTMSAYA